MFPPKILASQGTEAVELGYNAQLTPAPQILSGDRAPTALTSAPH